MTGSDPSEKIREIDLTGVDLEAGLDLELRTERTGVSSPRPSAGDSDRTVVLDSPPPLPETRVDLALDLLEPTRVIPSPPGIDADATAILSPMQPVIEPAPAAAPVSSAQSPASASSGVSPPPLPGPPPVPGSTDDAWSEIDSVLQRLDRLLAVSPLDRTSIDSSLHRTAAAEDEGVSDFVIVPEHPAEMPEARDHIDQAVAFLEMGLLSAARRSLESARGLDPRSAARIDALLAWTALLEDRPHESLRLCEEWRLREGLSPDESREFRYQAARALEMLDRISQACAEYRALLVAAPDYRDCAVRLRRLSGARR